MRSENIDKKFQESEKLYYMLFDHSMDGIILTDPGEGGKILSANPAACRMLGWTEEELIGKGCDVMLDLEDPALSTLLNERARSGSARAQFTYRRRNGITFPGEVSTTTFIDSNGESRAVTIIRDITERKQAEEALAKIEETRIKEIHHRIKNNLQVISSLLSLQAEKFSDAEVLDAFKDSQNRVASMALIHEELFRGKGTDNLDFAAYIQKLTRELFSSYNLRNEDINLKLNLEEAYLGMDTAIPLGIIVNELVSNSLKHAFPDGKKWEISINLKKTEDFSGNKQDSKADCECDQNKNFQYTLTVSDNGKGIPEEVDLRDPDSLGLQLVNILVEQIDGCIELRRHQGTEFAIWFSNIGK